MLRRQLHIAVMAATATVAVTLLGACSSSGGSSSSSSTSSGTSSGTSSSSTHSVTSSGTAGSTGGSAAGSAIQIGEVCSCSGPFGSDVSGARKVADAWVAATNAAGGLDGHPLKIQFKDDNSTPGTSVTAAQALISAHVAVILDLTILDSTWVKQASAAKIPVIGGNFSSDQYYQDPDWYPSGQTNDSIVYSNVATAKTAGGSKLGLLYCAESPQCQVSVAPTKRAASSLGLSLTYSGSIAGTAPNYTAQCLAAKQAGVDALIILDSPAVIRHVASDCTQQSYTPAFVQEGSSFDNQAMTAPGLKDHLWADFPVIPYFVDNAATRQMNAVLDKYSPGLRTDQAAWSQFSLQAWSAMLMLKQALTAAGITQSDTVSSAAIVKGLDMTKNDTLGGFSPPLTFTAGTAHKVDCWYTGRIQGGKATVVNGGKLSCQRSA